MPSTGLSTLNKSPTSPSTRSSAVAPESTYVTPASTTILALPISWITGGTPSLFTSTVRRCPAASLPALSLTV